MTSGSTRLLVGLGNPGERQANNRHNVGYVVVEAAARALGATPWVAEYGGLTARATVGDVRVVLLKPVDPQRGINGSGSSVALAATALCIDASDVVVVHDEMAIEPGQVRAKLGGGDAGHNGLKSVTGAVGADYARVRIGIGHPGTREAVLGHVLGDFEADGEAVLAAVTGVLEALPELLAGRLEAFLTRARVATAAGTEGRPTLSP